MPKTIQQKINMGKFDIAHDKRGTVFMHAQVSKTKNRSFFDVLRENIVKHKGKKENISGNIDKILYGI